MAEENLNPEEVALPTSHVLSYLTATGSPTRVRRVASVGMRVVGSLILLLMVPIFLALLHFLYTEWAGGLGGITFGSVIDEYKNWIFDSCVQFGVGMVDSQPYLGLGLVWFVFIWINNVWGLLRHPIAALCGRREAGKAADGHIGIGCIDPANGFGRRVCCHAGWNCFGFRVRGWCASRGCRAVLDCGGICTNRSDHVFIGFNPICDVDREKSY